jgi:predicted nuclease of predicted toxin-antitoxin system
MRGADDQAVIDYAGREERVLLTEDKDFGQLFFLDSKTRNDLVG